MTKRETLTVSVTMFGETREVEVEPGTRFCDWLGKGDRLTSVNPVLVGKFPTGTKLHRSKLDLWRRVQSYNPDHPLRGETAAVVNGEEYVASYTVYTHNTDNCRAVGWNKAFPPEVIAKWRSY